MVARPQLFCAVEGNCRSYSEAGKSAPMNSKLFTWSQQSGLHFDPLVVDALIEEQPNFQEIAQKYRDN